MIDVKAALNPNPHLVYPPTNLLPLIITTITTAKKQPTLILLPTTINHQLPRRLVAGTRSSRLRL
jgi:hypothetical protein